MATEREKRKDKFFKLWTGFLIVLALILLIWMFLTPKAKAQVFCEYFLNSFNSEYDSIMVICDSPDIIPVLHHYHGADPLSKAQSLQRFQAKGGGTIPTGFSGGYKLANLIDPVAIMDIGERQLPYSCDIAIDGYYRLQTDMSTQIGWDFEFSGYGSKIFIFITEDLCWGDGGNTHRHVMRRMLGVEGHEFTEKLHITTIFDNEWNVEKTSIVIMVEDIFGRVVGARQMGMKESITTGINNIVMPQKYSVYPNPADEWFAVGSGLEIWKLEAFNMAGKRMKVQGTPSYYYIENWPTGTYLLMINEVFQTMLIKQ